MTPEESAMVRDVLGDGYYVLLPSINEIKGIYSETVPWAKPRSLEHKEIAAERIIALVAERDRLAAALRDLLNAVGGETWSAMEETRAKKAARTALAAADRPEGTTPSEALRKIAEQASRHRRGTDEREYLLRDLEFIEQWATNAAADRPEGTTPLDEARAVYEAMARLLTSEGCRRQERGSGWWWAAGLDEEATVGGAVEQVLANYGIDTREPFPWETEFGWEGTTPQEGNA